MLNYLRTLFSLARAAAGILGPWRLALTILLGIVSRLILLACFISVIQLAVITLQPGALATVKLPDFIDLSEFPVERILETGFLIVPFLFIFAGWCTYFNQKLLNQATATFTLEVRKRNVNHRGTEILAGDHAERRQNVIQFASIQDPDLARSANALVSGVLGLMQSVILSGAIALALFFLNPAVLVTVVVLATVFLPRHVKKTYVNHLQTKKRTSEIGAQRKQERLSLADSEALLDDDSEEIEAELIEIIENGSSKVSLETKQQQQLDAKSAFPYLYGAFGIILSYLLFDVLSMDQTEKANAIGTFVITALLLRFFVGVVNQGLGSFRRVNVGYPMAGQVCGLLPRNGSRQ